VILRERFNGKELLGFAIAFVGLVTMTAQTDAVVLPRVLPRDRAGAAAVRARPGHRREIAARAHRRGYVAEPPDSSLTSS
jgi:hypothetical protein